MNTLILHVLKVFGIFLLVISFQPSVINAQQIIQTAEGDTLVAISPKDVRTINIVFEDHKLLEEKCNIQGEIIEIQNKRIENADTIIQRYSLLTDDLKKEIALRELAYENTSRKLKTNYFILGGVTGILVGTIVTLLICK